MGTRGAPRCASTASWPRAGAPRLFSPAPFGGRGGAARAAAGVLCCRGHGKGQARRALTCHAQRRLSCSCSLPVELRSTRLGVVRMWSRSQLAQRAIGPTHLQLPGRYLRYPDRLARARRTPSCSGSRSAASSPAALSAEDDYPWRQHARPLGHGGTRDATRPAGAIAATWATSAHEAQQVRSCWAKGARVEVQYGCCTQ